MRHGLTLKNRPFASPKFKQWGQHSLAFIFYNPLAIFPMHYISNCIDSFDLFGNCIVDLLPWATVTDFAQDVEYGGNITVGNVVVRYDDYKDIHSFYLLD